MRPGRPQQFDFETVLENAMNAFWARGYEACSMQHLLTATGLSKSSLYNQFGDKQKLFEQCLLRYRQQSAERLSGALNSTHSYRLFLSDILNSVATETCSSQSPRGCLIMNTATEFGQTNSEIAHLVGDSLQVFRGIFLKAIQRGQSSGEFSATLSAEDMATYIVSSMGGLRTMVKSGIDKETINNTVKIILRALD